MKLILTLSLLFITYLSHAITFEIQDPCSRKSLVVDQRDIEDLNQTVGSFTVEMLENYKIPFIGSEGGMNSILNTPIGLDALELLSDNEMRAYGWCYSINDDFFDLMIDEISFQSQDDKLVWYYGYAHYINGDWVEFCRPTKEVPPKSICK